MQKFFNTNRPYHIAETITGGHDLTTDLVAECYLMLRDREGIEDIAKFYSRFCYQQWNWTESEFNKKYRPHYTVEFDEKHKEDEVIIKNDQYKSYLRWYIDRDKPTPEEWYKAEIAKLVLKGMSRRQIAKETKINTTYIQQTIKQFERDVFNSFNSLCNWLDNTEPSDSE